MVAALGREVAGLLRRLEGARPKRLGTCLIHEGTVAGVSVRLAVTGMGAERASRGVRALMAGTPLHALLSLGFAGALVEGLQPGTLALPTCHLLDGEAAAYIEPDTGLRTRLISAARAAGLEPRAGTCVTAARVVTAPDVRAALGAAHAAELVDMEGYWLARAAAAADLPFVSARAVSDALPDYHPVLEGALRDDGVSVARLLRGYAARPREARKLGGLVRNARRAASALERFAIAALAALATETVL